MLCPTCRGCCTTEAFRLLLHVPLHYSRHDAASFKVKGDHKAERRKQGKEVDAMCVSKKKATHATGGSAALAHTTVRIRRLIPPHRPFHVHTTKADQPIPSLQSAAPLFGVYSASQKCKRLTTADKASPKGSAVFCGPSVSLVQGTKRLRCIVRHCCKSTHSANARNGYQIRPPPPPFGGSFIPFAEKVTPSPLLQ